ncbi:MAG: MerC family mercury resistance protein [Phenylobacterium sp.]
MSVVKSTSSRLPDAFALGVSGLCFGHCLALPVLGAILPFVGALAHLEWIHVLFLAVVAPASLVALFLTGGWRHL